VKSKCVVIGYSARHERGDRPSSFAGMPDESESFLRYPDETKTSSRRDSDVAISGSLTSFTSPHFSPGGVEN